MKKIASCLFFLYVSVFAFAQDTDVMEIHQKPTKEDFYHTWVTDRIEGKNNYSVEVTFNESAYTHVTTISRRKTTQNFSISSWEEVVNTYSEAEEYPFGFKISSKETKNGAESTFAMFINADKTKYLSVIDLGFHTQYDIYTKKQITN